MCVCLFLMEQKPIVHKIVSCKPVTNKPISVSARQWHFIAYQTKRVRWGGLHEQGGWFYKWLTGQLTNQTSAINANRLLHKSNEINTHCHYHSCHWGQSLTRTWQVNRLASLTQNTSVPAHDSNMGSDSTWEQNQETATGFGVSKLSQIWSQPGARDTLRVSEELDSKFGTKHSQILEEKKQS